jgi:hypothetical protein
MGAVWPWGTVVKHDFSKELPRLTYSLILRGLIPNGWMIRKPVFKIMFVRVFG